MLSTAVQANCKLKAGTGEELLVAGAVAGHFRHSYGLFMYFNAGFWALIPRRFSCRSSLLFIMVIELSGVQSWSEIIRVISKSNERAERVRFLLHPL